MAENQHLKGDLIQRTAKARLELVEIAKEAFNAERAIHWPKVEAYLYNKYAPSAKKLIEQMNLLLNENKELGIEGFEEHRKSDIAEVIGQ